MPFVTAPYDGTSIYYAVHGGNALPHADPRPKVVLLMGFAASSVAWAPQLADLLCGTGDDQTPAMAVCVLDNRGIGRSGAPTSLTAYSTGIMALDVLQVMNELGWEKFHVVGHSMGGMIAMLVAATAPERVASLTVISVTAGGPWYRFMLLSLSLSHSCHLPSTGLRDTDNPLSPRYPAALQAGGKLCHARSAACGWAFACCACAPPKLAPP